MLTIVIGLHQGDLSEVHSTTLHRWYSETRTNLFDQMSYARVNPDSIRPYAIPKLGSPEDVSIATKLLSVKERLGNVFTQSPKYPVLYNRSFLYWFKSFTFYPKFYSEEGNREQSDDHQKALFVKSREEQHVISALLNSSLVYWYTIKYSNGREFTRNAIFDFPFDPSALTTRTRERLISLCENLMADLNKNSHMKSTTYKGVGKIDYQEFFFGPSKPIIDQIDRALAQVYRFTEKELDYIVNYDIKFRMGRDLDNDDEE